MKPRRVILTLEVETDAPLRAFVVHPDENVMAVEDRRTGKLYHVTILQAQANVVRATKKEKKRR